MIDLLKTIITPTINGYLCEIKDSIHLTVIYIKIDMNPLEPVWSITTTRPQEFGRPPLIMSIKSYDVIRTIATIGIVDFISPNFTITGNNRFMLKVPEFYEDADGKILGKCIKYVADQLKIY